MKKNQVSTLLIYFGFTLIRMLFNNIFKYANDVLIIIFEKRDVTV